MVGDEMAKQVRPKSAQGSASSLIFTFDVKRS